jgi:hypothetical protein
MGGWGSGRNRSSKNTTSEYLRLDIRRLRQEGVLERCGTVSWQWTRNDEPYANIHIRPEADRVVLAYRHRRGGNDWQSKEYPVYLVQSHCHLGGARKWFLCPARGCGRRVAVLYGGGIFACRQCHQLAYDSQREQPHDRALSRLQKLHIRLGGSGAVADGLPPKPKRMHRKTYGALANRFLRHEMAMNSAAVAYFRLLS